MSGPTPTLSKLSHAFLEKLTFFFCRRGRLSLTVKARIMLRSWSCFGANEDVVKWLDVRDMIFNDGKFAVGMQLAADCNNDEARWICGIFHEGWEKHYQVFLKEMLEEGKTITVTVENDEGEEEEWSLVCSFEEEWRREERMKKRSEEEKNFSNRGEEEDEQDVKNEEEKEGGHVDRYYEARIRVCAKWVLLSLGQDARSLFWAAQLCRHDVSAIALFKRAASLGHGGAQGYLASCMQLSVEENIAMGFRAAEQNDRVGFYYLFFHLYDGADKCAQEKALSFLGKSLDLGCHYAISRSDCYVFRSVEDFERVSRFLHVAATGQYFERFISSVLREIRENEIVNDTNERFVWLGRFLNRSPGFLRKIDSKWCHSARNLLQLYSEWSHIARECAVAFVLCARHLGMAKDLRVMIAKQIWDETFRCLIDHRL